MKSRFTFLGIRDLGLGIRCSQFSAFFRNQISKIQSPIPNPQSLSVALCILLLATSLFATQARIESMGKRSAFFLDPMNMFENPANATFYSNALFGELGFYSQDNLDERHIGINQDPFTPWFGALFKYGLSNEGIRDPQITIGGFFGRENYNFTRFVPKKVVISSDTIVIPKSITNFDAFLAGTMMDGSAVGTHVYVGIQDGKQDDNFMTPEAHVSILAMDYGANFLVTSQSSIELALGVARIQYGPSRKTFLDPGLFSFYSHGRFFLEMNAWDGQLVTGYKVADMEVPGWRENFYNINTGINVIIPRGLVWVGLDAVYATEKVSTWDLVKEYDSDDKLQDSYLIYREPGSLETISEDTADRMGGIISFGIERNVWSTLLTLRAGGQKSFIYNTCKNGTGRETICAVPQGQKGNYWTTNPYGDGTLDDHLGFGIGFNIDRKLTIDASVSEDIIFRNPFAGQSRFLTRISAMYSF